MEECLIKAAVLGSKGQKLPVVIRNAELFREGLTDLAATGTELSAYGLNCFHLYPPTEDYSRIHF